MLENKTSSGKTLPYVRYSGARIKQPREIGDVAQQQPFPGVSVRMKLGMEDEVGKPMLKARHADTAAIRVNRSRKHILGWQNDVAGWLAKVDMHLNGRRPIAMQQFRCVDRRGIVGRVRSWLVTGGLQRSQRIGAALTRDENIEIAEKAVSRIVVDGRYQLSTTLEHDGNNTSV